VARPRRQSELPGAAELYDRLLAEQGGVCAICGATPKTRRLHIDHDHKTGRVRGLLCHRCNGNLPTWVTPAWLREAYMYLNQLREFATIDPKLPEAYPAMVTVQREAARGVPESPREGTGSR
jgi:Recombination endonuclease VII